MTPRLRVAVNPIKNLMKILRETDINENYTGQRGGDKTMLLFLCLLLLFPFDYFSPAARAASLPAQQLTERQTPTPAPADSTVYLEAEMAVREPLPETADNDSTQTVVTADDYMVGEKKIFNPSPERAVWLSALFPGLGQLYNRRYWKLPIVVGGFMGLAYATSWNNGQYQDYVQGYNDLLDSDPSTNSYMNFFPPTTSETDLDKTWLQNVMKSRKDYYRRNRDLCIIFLVALYLVCMVDAYVDASLAHFDISPNLSMDVAPALINAPASRKPAVGLNWALTF